MATQTQQDQDNADFAAQFNADDTKKIEKTDDEEFGLNADDAGSATPADAGAAAAGTPAPAASEADDATAVQAKALAEREAQLNAREQELDARAASQQTSNTNEVQTSTPKEEGAPGATEGDSDGVKDPRAALAEDFGPEFVTLLEAFIKDVCKGSVTDQIGSLQSTVQSVIEDLQNERNHAHFKTIAAAHDDFMDIVESPEFKTWLASLPEHDKAEMDKVVESGSAKEIIDMLTQFKASKSAGAGGDVDEAALDGAEGVRSTGIRLPEEPAQSNDYAAAWNAA